MKTNMATIASINLLLLLFIYSACPSQACCPIPLPPPPCVPTIPSLPPATKTCPTDVYVKLGVCSPILGLPIVGGLLGTDCCGALLGLVGLDVEVCLCLAIDANVLGIINLHAKIDAVVTILTACNIPVPKGLKCPSG